MKGVDELHDHFSKAIAPILPIPRNVRAAALSTRNVFPMIDAMLLSTTFTERGKRPTNLGRTTGQISLIRSDTTDHVQFYPSLYFAQRWHRRDDDVDYAFERWRDGGHGGDHDCQRAIPAPIRASPAPGATTNSTPSSRTDEIR